MSPPLPLIGAGELVDAAAKALRDWDALMVVEEGKPVGVITRHDLLGFLSDEPPQCPANTEFRDWLGRYVHVNVGVCTPFSGTLCRFTSANTSAVEDDMTEQPPGPPPGNYPPPRLPAIPATSAVRRGLLPAASAVAGLLSATSAAAGGTPRRRPVSAWVLAGTGSAARSATAEAYTSWATRVVAWIIDYLPYLIVVGIGYGIEAATQETACVTDTSEYNLGEFCATGNSTLGVAALMLSVLIGLAYLMWNYGYRQGTTGSSIGKSIMKFKVVSEKTGQPIGFGLSVVRQLAHTSTRSSATSATCSRCGTPSARLWPTRS